VGLKLVQAPSRLRNGRRFPVGIRRGPARQVDFAQPRVEKKTRSKVKVDLFLQVRICSEPKKARQEVSGPCSQSLATAVLIPAESSRLPCKTRFPVPASVHRSCDPKFRQIKCFRESGFDRPFWGFSDDGSPRCEPTPENRLKPEGQHRTPPKWGTWVSDCRNYRRRVRQSVFWAPKGPASPIAAAPQGL
jgi:hypothetical protein